ncbi:hypothetical protein [Winogradskyella sp.]|uniref:hypothetical protein n=1 Tax=Winogradskyella sp. TaxID=1883156 RepID=UPI003BAA43AA
MGSNLIIAPDDSMWWILRPEFTVFTEKIYMSKKQYHKEEESKDRSGYHKVTWDRLQVLLDNNLVEIKDFKLNENQIDKETDLILAKIIKKKEVHPSLLNDMIFAYNYWIEFNNMKLDLVPEDQDYHADILKNMPLWKDDLDILKRKGNEAFYLKEAIIKYATRNIIKKVLTLKHLNKEYNSCPLTALKEYEPFLKYIELDLDAPLITERTAFTYKNKIPSKFINGSIHLPLEPEYDFMRFNLSKIKFNNVYKSIFHNYKQYRLRVKELMKYSEEVAFNLSEGKLKKKVTDDFLSINRELLNNHRDIRRNSNYLAYSFFGLSLIPVPALAALFGFLGLQSTKVSEFLDSAKMYLKGISNDGLAAYYAFNETLMDTKRLEKFPDIQKENSKFGYGKEKFWREK